MGTRRGMEILFHLGAHCTDGGLLIKSILRNRATLSREGYKELGRQHLLEPTNGAWGRKVVWSQPAFAMKSMFARNETPGSAGSSVSSASTTSSGPRWQAQSPRSFTSACSGRNAQSRNRGPGRCPRVQVEG